MALTILMLCVNSPCLAQGKKRPRSSAKQPPSSIPSSDSTLEETLKFIKNVVGRNAYYSYQNIPGKFVASYKLRTIDFEGCAGRLSFDRKYSYTSPSKIERKRYYVKFNLGDMDTKPIPVATSPDFSFLTLTAGKAWNVHTRVEESLNLKTSVSENTGPFVEVSFRNMQDAKRVAHAFEHAIRLCVVHR